MFTYRYSRPALSVDCVIFGFDEGELKVLLIERGNEPFRGRWALPGGFVDEADPTIEHAAKRELAEETGLTDVFMEQLYTFGDVGRDPRERVVSVAYYALIKLADYRVQAGDDASRAQWFGLSQATNLAFDHDKILEVACGRLRGKVRYQPIGFELLPQKFTLSQLQSLYEAVLGQPLDKRNFRKKILRMDLLRELPETQANVSHRAARYYQFDQHRYDALLASGFNFEL